MNRHKNINSLIIMTGFCIHNLKKPKKILNSASNDTQTQSNETPAAW